MRVHIEEVKFAQAYRKELPFESLTHEQVRSIMSRGRELFHWFKDHHRTHCLINVAVLTFLLGGDYLVLMRLPGWWLVPGQANPIGRVVAAGIVVGLIRCWLMYSLGVFTLHEGAAHKIIFPPRGPLSRLGNFIACNLSRISGAEPGYYSKGHMIHHSKFGTEDDAEFLNFVSPKRYWPSFLPLAAVFNYTDFIVHRPIPFTWGLACTSLVAVAYHGIYMTLAYRRWGLVFVLLVLFCFTHIGFYLDRVRQYTEHNLMPLDNLNGSRSFGLGFWGLLIGGGPWGTPCHWEHHLVASIPWYQQILLHRHVTRLLTPRQREQFLLEPVVGFPKLWWRVLQESKMFLRIQGKTAQVSSK